ncbi:GtrA family protein [Aurantiacibacter odishensis]|uniref:GtrA family protein n=1 Tax=Aurantiacibacter odishensis TaxID=1155476 RepID=UPI000E71736D|nr:GtrA family protein [Aurantiacibacter odishensis]
MPAVFMRMIDTRLVRYLLASVGALAVDMGTFLALLSLGIWAAGASAVGYCLGIAAHWLMSSRAVFIGNVAERGAARTRQKALFVISALVGLGLTTAIVWAGDASGFDPRLAKLVAIAVSFVATWLLRSRVVFR